MKAVSLSLTGKQLLTKPLQVPLVEQTFSAGQLQYFVVLLLQVAFRDNLKQKLVISGSLFFNAADTL